MSDTTAPSLPPEFSDLEPFAAKWCLPTERERFAMRLASTMDEMQAFYDAITARADEAMTYCDGFPLDHLPEDATNLLHLLFSMVMPCRSRWSAGVSLGCPTPVRPTWTCSWSPARERASGARSPASRAHIASYSTVTSSPLGSP